MTLEVFLMDFCLSVLQLATCIAKDANPAANITWLKNNKPLVDGGKGVLLCYKTHHCIVNINGIINVMKTHVSIGFVFSLYSLFSLYCHLWSFAYIIAMDFKSHRHMLSYRAIVNQGID